MKLLHKIAREAEGLTYLELVKLDEAIHRLLDSRMVAEAEIRERPDREVIERKRVGNITYQLERVRCGKAKLQVCQRQPARPVLVWVLVGRRQNQINVRWQATLNSKAND